MSEAAPWWVDLYDELLADVLLDGADPEEAERTADLLVSATGVAPGDAVMDQGCGTGRVLVPLARRGLRVWGVDLVPAYVARANAALAAAGLSGEAVVGDIAEAVAPASVALVLSWWTCLGYAPTDAENVQPLRRACESLRPGGLYAVDFMNIAQVMRAFRPRVVTVGRGRAAGVTLVRESQLDLAAGVLRKKWTWTLPDGRSRVVPSAVRLYLPHELGRLLGEAGFVDVAFLGDLDGRPLDEDSPRCIALARKAA